MTRHYFLCASDGTVVVASTARVTTLLLFARLSRIQNTITLIVPRRRQVWSYTAIYAVRL